MSASDDTYLNVGSVREKVVDVFSRFLGAATGSATAVCFTYLVLPRCKRENFQAEWTCVLSTPLKVGCHGVEDDSPV